MNTQSTPAHIPAQHLLPLQYPMPGCVPVSVPPSTRPDCSVAWITVGGFTAPGFFRGDCMNVQPKRAPSAEGLFRATGNKRRERPVRMLDGSIQKTDQQEREADDFYPTPPEPTRALLHAEQNRLRDFGLIWEPACGDGAMVREIRTAGHTCVGTDLIDRDGGAVELRDFFDFDEPLAPAIVTNPPYSAVNWRDGKGRWITHAMEGLGVEYMALLLNWSWPGAGNLARIWAAHPPARVYLMRWKIDFTGQGQPPMQNGWFVWDKAVATGETQLIMLDRASDARQGDLL